MCVCVHVQSIVCHIGVLKHTYAHVLPPCTKPPPPTTIPYTTPPPLSHTTNTPHTHSMLLRQPPDQWFGSIDDMTMWVGLASQHKSSQKDGEQANRRLTAEWTRNRARFTEDLKKVATVKRDGGGEL